MAAHINTNKANLSNKVLLYFSHPLKHTHYNLWGECLDLRSESLKSSAPLSFPFFLLYWGIPLSRPTSGVVQKRAGRSIVNPLEFQSCLIVFSAGHLTTPPPSSFPTPPHARSLFSSSIIPLTRFRVFWGSFWRGVLWGVLRSRMKGG